MTSPRHTAISTSALFSLDNPHTVVFFGRVPAAIAIDDAVSGGEGTPLAGRIVVIGEMAADTSAAELAQKVGRCINFGARGVVLDNAAQPEPLSQEVLRSLNLEPRRINESLTVQVYDADSANRPREWNTAENWANPERFGRRF